MDFLAIFIPVFLVLFLIIPCICFFLRFEFKNLRKIYPERSARQCRHPSHQLNYLHCQHFRIDRQGNIFTISDENAAARSYPDFFVVEPSSESPRGRGHMEKVDKDLPTYEEVMAATLAASAASYEEANRSTQSRAPQRTDNDITRIDISRSNSSNLPLDVPPYSEIDPNPLPSPSRNLELNSSSHTMASCGSESAVSSFVSSELTSTISSPSSSDHSLSSAETTQTSQV